MTRMLAAVTYADLVPHNRVFGVGRGLFSRGPLSRGIALVCPAVKAEQREAEQREAPPPGLAAVKEEPGSPW